MTCSKSSAGADCCSSTSEKVTTPGFFVRILFGKFRNSESENSQQAKSCFRKLAACDRMPEEKRITGEQDSA
jgi:hypothetical protein